MPEAVIAATGDYRKESDKIGQFVEAWLDIGRGFEVRTSAVYNVYKNWCVENGYHPENAKNFNRALGTKFDIVKRRPSDGSGSTTTLLIGCRLKPDEEAIIYD